jgi:hypothetical protein
VAVGSSNETAGDVVAEKRNARGVAAVAYIQRAACASGVLQVGKRCLRAKGDVWQADAIPRERASCVWLDAAAVDDTRIGDPDVAGYRAAAEIRRRVVTNQDNRCRAAAEDRDVDGAAAALDE